MSPDPRPWNADIEARDEAARLIREQGYAILWTPVVGRVEVRTIEEWDALVARRIRTPRSAAS